MSEKEKMHEDNLPEHNQARGDEDNVTPDVNTDQPTESSDAAKGHSPADSDPIDNAGDAIIEENRDKDLSAVEEQKEDSPEKGPVAEQTQEQQKDSPEKDPVAEEPQEQDSMENDSSAGEKPQEQPRNAQQEMDDAVAEESEDESTNGRHKIEKKEYASLSKEELVDEFERLLKKEEIQNIKEHIDEIRAEFNSQFDEELEEKKEEFLADGGNIIDFYYSTSLKKRFNSLYFDYKEKRNLYYEQLKKDLNKNLQRRLEIIEELKGLIDVEENINTTYNNFKRLQESWRNAGPIPRDKYNTIWNTYHHHVENFYDFLHLNREFRDLDFKHNLEQKLKIVSRAEELTQESDVNRAFRELQMLHKMWKEDLGPVEKQYREDIWQKFSEATSKIHERRQEHFQQLDKVYQKNLEEKLEIIAKIGEIGAGDYKSHREWQQKIKEVEALREDFFKAGKVPRNVTEDTWKKFKQNVRAFNRKKNGFYKNQKKEQSENLEKKLELVEIAEANKDSEDFELTTELMKRIQSDWKKIGHVPKKDSDKIWKRFKSACNHYFDRLHAHKNDGNREEMEAFDRKKSLLDELRSVNFSGERDKDLPVIKKFIEDWKNIGKVSSKKRFIEGKFNKTLDPIFKKLDMDRKQAEMLKYENKLQELEESDDNRQINKEHFFLTKKIEETQAEIRQLENNLQFFSNVEDDNPLVKEVRNNIQKHKDQLNIWKKKLERVNSLYEEN